MSFQVTPVRMEPKKSHLTVLISAYACSPEKGSEPGIGWNNAREAARQHEVWVITRPDFRVAIEAELKRNPLPQLHVVYYQLPRWTHVLGSKVRYYLWQIAIYFIARRLHAAHGFDVGHHVSYVRSWSPSLLALLPIPFIWGPVGGGETIPTSFRRDLSLRARLEELQRDLVGWLSSFDPLLRLTARKSVIVLANSAETADRVRQLGARRVEILGESGLDEIAMAPAGGKLDFHNTPVRFASLTRLVYWKGLHLGLQAFARLKDQDAVYWIIGEGPEEQRLRAQAEALGIADRVVFRQGLSREEWMSALREIDVLVHPCICNTGNAITLEAMAAGRPVICLDRGGVSMQVTEETGFKIPANDPEQAVAGLERVMRVVIEDREGAAAMGSKARQWAERSFSWTDRGKVMQSYYQEAVSHQPQPQTGLLISSSVRATS